MNDKESNSKCEDDGYSTILFKVTILSACRNHLYTEVYYSDHVSSVISNDAQYLQLLVFINQIH